MPSIEVLADAAMNSDRRAAVVHILESSVVSWMKQVKVYCTGLKNNVSLAPCGKDKIRCAFYIFKYSHKCVTAD